MDRFSPHPGAVHPISQFLNPAFVLGIFLFYGGIVILKGKDFEIRPLTACKLDSAVQVYRHSGEGYRAGSVTGQTVLEDMDLSRAEGGIFCGIYNQEDDLVGVVDFVPAGFSGLPDSACVRSLKISAEFQGKGWAGKTLERLEEELKKDGSLKWIWSCFRDDCPDWKEFSTRHGYRLVDEEERSRFHLPEDVAWVKILA